MVRILLVAAVTALAVSASVGCATPRWVNASDRQPSHAINGEYVQRALVAALRRVVDDRPGPAPYDLVLPRGATPETYARVAHGLGPDARVPAGIPAVAVDPETGRVEARDKAVRAAERREPPRAAPEGDRPVVRVTALRLNGQTGEVDVVAPAPGGASDGGPGLVTVGLGLDLGHGWHVTGVRRWRGVDPEAGL